MRSSISVLVRLMGFATLLSFAQFGWSAEEKEMAEAKPAAEQTAAERLHAEVLISSRFPSATKCAACHPTQYRQWSASQHSYAQLSPIFNAMQGRHCASDQWYQW